MSGMNMGTKNGLTRPGPRSIMTRVCSSNVAIPPIPLPMSTPTRSESAGARSSPRPAWRTACSATATANWANRSVRRASFRSMYSTGSKPFTSQAKRTLNWSVASNWVMVAAPLVPASSAAHAASTSLPTGVSRPRPVMTTRWRPFVVRVSINLQAYAA
jgi:hypothetical protein